MNRWIYFNPNPKNQQVGDCPVRAIAKALNMTWEEAYTALCVEGMRLGDMPSADRVWGAFLRRHGFSRRAVPDTCPDCYTVAAFCREHPEGTFILTPHAHVLTVIDGDWYDSWDSGNAVPTNYWRRDYHV